MTPYLTTSFDGYVANGYTTPSGYFTPETGVTGAFPQIVDKLSGGANIAIIDNNGSYVDSYVDVLAYVLPEQFMDIDYNIKQR